MKTILILTDNINVPWLDAEQQKNYEEKMRRMAPGLSTVFMSKKSLRKEDIRQAEIIVGWGSLVKTICEEEEIPLRWVQSWSAGVDKLPMPLFEQKNLFLTTASGIHANPLSETIMGLLLGLSRGFGMAGKAQAQHKWLEDEIVPYAQGELHGKTVGILGAGKMGTSLAVLCKAFECTILGLSRSGSAKDGFDAMYRNEEITEVLQRSDYVVNLLPLTAQTHGIMNKEMFCAMKNSAYYLGVGRGPTTITEDLVEALQQGRIAGAGLDVTDPEPLPPESPLWDMPNVIILPHLGGISRHYAQRLMDLFLENLKAYVKNGRPSYNLVEYTRQY